MKKEKSSKKRTYGDVVMERPATMVVVAILSIAMGLFFIFMQKDNKPIPREEAVAYSGNFDRYERSKNSRGIYFEDGSCYWLYPHTESKEFREHMGKLQKGTTLYILINPNNEYVVEIKTDTEELLNFETSQMEIDEYDNGYIYLGILSCIGGIFLIGYAIAGEIYKRKESACQVVKKASCLTNQANSPVLRMADEKVKCRILLEAQFGGYHICYRRVKSVNELVVNGRVYDEKRGVLEFAHRLNAVVDGHKIEAGLYKDEYSFILFDGKLLNYKKRWI